VEILHINESGNVRMSTQRKNDLFFQKVKMSSFFHN
jgi:hypothetical protein